MGTPKTILLVDDDIDIINAMQTVLERRGYRLVTAADGNMALALAEREAPDLIVVDMMMPKKSGLVVLEKLQERKMARRPRLIMITAKDGDRYQAYAEALGVDDYIRKPFDMDRLLDSVERLCPTAAPKEEVLQD